MTAPGRRVLLARLDPDERFGVRMLMATIGLVLAVPFTVLALLVVARWSPLIHLDAAIDRSVHREALRAPWTIHLAWFFTFFGNTATRAVVAVVVSLGLLAGRRVRLAVWFGVTCAIGGVLDTVAKLITDRARPSLPHPITLAHGTSFPSGHAMGSMVTYGALLLVVLGSVPSRRRWMVRATAVILIAAIGGSRVVLGVHYPSDVVGGWLIGFTCWRSPPRCSTPGGATRASGRSVIRWRPASTRRFRRTAGRRPAGTGTHRARWVAPAAPACPAHASDPRRAVTVGPVPRSYEVRTYGCQMNVHDSERLAGSLEAAGYERAASGTSPDVIVINTCAVRENADNRLYGNLGHLRPVKAAHPGMQIAVGGCLAQKDKGAILRRAPWVDVVFGTYNLGSLPVLLERARIAEESQVELLEALEVFPSALPARRESAYSAWVSISVGCDNTCTFCIVPSLRGSERDRRPGDVLAEVAALAGEGVIEVTLLGQNVNSYGREFGDRFAFGKLLRACGGIAGLERVRFTSPHPRDFTDDVIAAMAETPNVMPSLHMPLQSGSDDVLRRMRRSYRRDRYLAIIDRVRRAMPEAAITTDVIVGFPGESEADFAATLDVVRSARFAGAYTFQYSPRPGTPAAGMPAQVPKAVVQERYARLVSLQEEISWAENKRLVGRPVEVLISSGEGRKDAATARLTGRARDNRLVHLSPVEGVGPGDVVTVAVTYAAPHHLVADGAPLSVRRTGVGGRHPGSAETCVTGSASTRPAGGGLEPPPTGVLLGMPGVGAPA